MHRELEERHNLPHIHCIFGEHETVVGLNGEMIEGWLTTNKPELVVSWITTYRKLPLRSSPIPLCGRRMPRLQNRHAIM